ncbi:TraR/DksA family transcriptional regulator [Geomesophilobacter sediminis]|uniref:TraR/DksA family transcriptional regulator n=1 Tax=Geomesophilobacter sediminis TaxID=2798584 RepID=A0A8J7JHQ4_9BACT|nr:TraR/DksA family transcriptional regulator [Geomesophilobacter sediminis]MBJ6723990.1 TraR/DksA family transcriptional regulator [Geomesophilobacter sediminis]
MAELSPGTHSEFKDLLAERKRRLWAELRDEIFRSTGESLANQYDIPQDVGDSSILDMLSDAGLAVADIRREELTQLEEAQRRLEEGTYGKCERCGRPIGAQRLNLVPFTRYCVSCQTDVEGPAKGPGTKL